MSKHRPHMRPTTELPSPPAAMVPNEIPRPPPSPAPVPLVVPPARLSWAWSRGYGRPIAHAFVVGAPRSVCRHVLTSHGFVSETDGMERCHDCQRLVTAIENGDEPSVPNLEG